MVAGLGGPSGWIDAIVCVAHIADLSGNWPVIPGTTVPVDKRL